MNCRQVHHCLLAWIEGDLDEASWLAVAQHLDRCEHCQKEAQKWQQLIAGLKAIANADSVPPIPQRLWQKLKPHRKRLPSLAAIFATACLAFLLGWHARSIALPHQPLQSDVGKAVRANARTVREQGNMHKGQRALSLSAPAKVYHQESSRQKGEMSSGSFSPVPTSFRRSHSLTLNGATAMACGLSDANFRTNHSLHSSHWTLKSEPIANELQVSENDGELSAEFALVFVPIETLMPQPQPYRIFVQVIDPQTQTVRTVKVDKTEPQHVVAEWSEVSGSEMDK